MQKNLNKAEMTEAEAIQAIVNQAAIRVMTAVMMAQRYTDVQLWPATTASCRAAETDTWLTSPRKVFIELECPGHVCLITG